MSAVRIAGVDIGGGGIRVRVQYGERTADETVNGPVPYGRGQVSIPRLVPRIAGAVRAAAARLGVARLDCVAIGSTGLPGLVSDPDLFARDLRVGVRSDAVIVAGDALTTHVGALQFRAGVVISAGTGVIALGTDFGETWNQADGWGIVLGDEGGGAWIGMMGLKAALRACDGRPNGSPLLLETMRRTLGNPAQVLAMVSRQRPPARYLADFAPAVADAARAGDPVAGDLWRAAGVHLAQAAVAALPNLEPVFSWGGRLFDAGNILLEPFTTEIGRLLPNATFLPPAGSATDGALALAREHLRQRLSPRAPYLYFVDS